MQDGSFEPGKKTGNAEVQRMSFEGDRTSYVDETLRLLKERREELRAQLATIEAMIEQEERSGIADDPDARRFGTAARHVRPY
jgi:hypothetical protein